MFITKALALGLKMMLLTSVVPETKTAVIFETSKVAVSDKPLGMVGGVQFAA